MRPSRACSGGLWSEFPPLCGFGRPLLSWPTRTMPVCCCHVLWSAVHRCFASCSSSCTVSLRVLRFSRVYSTLLLRRTEQSWILLCSMWSCGWHWRGWRAMRTPGRFSTKPGRPYQQMHPFGLQPQSWRKLRCARPCLEISCVFRPFKYNAHV